jgi:fatty-acyl-CoA synthase
VRQGDRIALLSHNHGDYVITCLALARLGAIAVPINFMLNATEVGYILGHAEVNGVVVEDALMSVANAALDAAGRTDHVSVRVVIGGADQRDAWEPFAALAAHSDASEPSVSIADDDIVQLMYTSGTEWRPKGTMMTTRSLTTQYVSCIVSGRFDESDVEIHALPLFHVAAQHCFLLPSLYLGATNVILDGPEPSALLAAVESERATKMFCPPTVWISLLRHPDFDRRDLSTLHKGYYGASVMPVEIIKELRARLPGMGLFNFYGQTEMSALALALAPEDADRKPGSAGRPVLNVESRVVDPDGVPVPAGTEGEIVHRSPHATLGYWRDPDSTARAFRGSWFHSGDLGVADEEGYISVVDRIKDMIKTGGENVASREVEEVCTSTRVSRRPPCSGWHTPT